MRTTASPALKNQGSRRWNDKIMTKTRMAASLVCHPTVSAMADTNSTAHPIQRAWLLVQMPKTPQVYRIDGSFGVTPRAANASFRIGRSHSAHTTASAPNPTLTKPSVYIGSGRNQNACQAWPIAEGLSRTARLSSVISFLPTFRRREGQARSLRGHSCREVATPQSAKTCRPDQAARRVRLIDGRPNEPSPPESPVQIPDSPSVFANDARRQYRSPGHQKGGVSTFGRCHRPS